MEYEVSSLENEQQFWDELDEIVSARCDSENLIDNVLRAYLNFTSRYKPDYLHTNYDVTRCSYKLVSSSLFSAHADYIRRQIIHSLLQEDSPSTLHLVTSFLLFDGRQNEGTLYMMSEEGSFPRLMELIQRLAREGRVQVQVQDQDHNQEQEQEQEQSQAQSQDAHSSKVDDDDDDGQNLQRGLMDLLYEMARIQRLRIEDLILVDDEFIKCLFEAVEELSYDSSDPYHYPVIRVLLVLNEQFMISAHGHVDGRAPTNKVVKVLSMHGNLYKTFGENIILLINREAETSLQLLTLKLLYLIFTTPSTYEYFYTNDLHVLVDILIRNLLDLPVEAIALRHTYLRVLYPLLAHTQLKYPPHYKRDELRRMLNILVPGQFQTAEDETDNIVHFNDSDDTTKRLVGRCANVEWIKDEEIPGDGDTAEGARPASPSSLNLNQNTPAPTLVQSPPPIENETDAGYPVDTGSPTDGRQQQQQQRWSHPGSTQNPSIGQSVGAQSERTTSSTSSVHEVAALQHEKGPGEPSSSSSKDTNTNTINTVGKKSKIKPEPPKARRSRGRNVTITEADNQARPRRTATTPPPPPPPPPHKSATIPATPSVTATTNRRNSVGSSSSSSLLSVPVIPNHARRSASHSPPAIPPPRRSMTPSHTHAHLSAATATKDGTTAKNGIDTTTNDNDNHADSTNNDAAGSNSHQHQHQHHQQQQHSKHGPKPEPPQTRRHRRTTVKHAQHAQHAQHVQQN